MFVVLSVIGYVYDGRYIELFKRIHLEIDDGILHQIVHYLLYESNNPGILEHCSVSLLPVYANKLLILNDITGAFM